MDAEECVLDGEISTKMPTVFVASNQAPPPLLLLLLLIPNLILHHLDSSFEGYKKTTVLDCRGGVCI